MLGSDSSSVKDPRRALESRLGGGGPAAHGTEKRWVPELKGQQQRW